MYHADWAGGKCFERDLSRAGLRQRAATAILRFLARPASLPGNKENQIMSTIHLYILAFVVAALSCRAAAPKTVDEVVRFCTQKVAGYNTWSGDYQQSMDMMGSKMNMTGAISFKQPAQMRMAVNMLMMGMTNKMLMVQGADKIMWQEMNMMGQKQVMKMDLTKIPTNSPLAAAMDSQLSNPQEQWKKQLEMYGYTLVGSDTVRGEPVFVLDGILKKDAQLPTQQAAMLKQLGKSRMYLGQNDGFLRKTEQYDKENKTIVMTMEFTNIKLNPALSDELFKYQPPEGAKIMDMTEMMQQMGTSSGPEE
jgi:outer membrane lipoprotein-sorting protein